MKRPSTNLVKVPENIRARRKKLGLTSQQLAFLSGLHQVTMYRIESQKNRSMNQSSAQAIERVLSMSPAELSLELGERGQPKIISGRSSLPIEHVTTEELGYLTKVSVATGGRLSFPLLKQLIYEHRCDHSGNNSPPSTA